MGQHTPLFPKSQQEFIVFFSGSGFADIREKDHLFSAPLFWFAFFPRWGYNQQNGDPLRGRPGPGPAEEPAEEKEVFA